MDWKAVECYAKSYTIAELKRKLDNCDRMIRERGSCEQLRYRGRMMVNAIALKIQEGWM